MLLDTTPPLTPFDQHVYQILVPPNHYLRLVETHIDFEAFRPSLNTFYSPIGRPSIDPVRMIKILFLAYHYRLSDRAVIARLQTDVAFRWFLRLPLDSSLPHHTDSTYFRERLGDDGLTTIFQALITQARNAGLIRDRLRLKDATHVHAKVADIRPLELAAQVRDRVLLAAEPYDAEWVQSQRNLMESVRAATEEAPAEERLASRVEFLRTMTQSLRERLAAVLATPAEEGDKARQRLDKVLKLVEKFLKDRDQPEGDYVFSAVDEEARVGKHGDFFVGYLLDVAIDPESELVTAINVLPGNGAEAADTAVLIRQEETAQGNDVAEVSIDGIGYNGPVLRELSDPTGLNLVVTVPPRQTPERTTFGPERFTLRVLEDQTRELQCPNGQTTRRHRRNGANTGDRFTFADGACAGCPLRSECLENPSSARGRSVDKNDYAAEYARVEERAKTESYRATRREHGKVERKLGELVQHHGAREARYRLTWKVRVQMLLTGLVVNVKRMVKLLESRVRELGAAELAAGVRAEVMTTG